MNGIGTGILAAAIMVALPLNALGECHCFEPGEEPYIPCGSSVAPYEMAYLRKEIKAYLDEVKRYMECLGMFMEEGN